MEILFVIGHLIVGLYFLHAGISHFFKTNYMANFAGSKGVPWPKAAVIASGITFMLGGISLIGWIAPVIGLGLIILTLIPVTTMMHNYWTITDPMQRATDQISFNKNIALIGTLILILAFFI